MIVVVGRGAWCCSGFGGCWVAILVAEGGGCYCGIIGERERE